MKTLFLRLFFLVSLCTLFVSCNPNTDDDDDEDEVQTVTEYGIKLNTSVSGTSYHRVRKYTAVETSTNNYDVQDLQVYYFPSSAYAFKYRTEQELMNIVKAETISPSSKSTVTLSEDTTYKVNTSSATKNFNLKSGQSYTENFLPSLSRQIAYNIKGTNGFYIVWEYIIEQTGDNTYDVKAYYTYMFSTSSYSADSDTLCEKAANQKTTDYSTYKDYTQAEAKTTYINKSDGTKTTLNIASGVPYTIYIYN